MTPKEWAFKLIAALDAARRSGEVVHEHELTEAAFEQAITDEREACAKLADDSAAEWAGQHGRSVAYQIAAFIRSRGDAAK